MFDRYLGAKEIYKAIGVDTENALAKIEEIPISIHCWQGDDVLGFDGANALSGGIQTTGNYVGRAQTPEQLFADIKKAFSLMPGKKRLNLHASYAILGDDQGKVDRDKYTFDYFKPWVDFARKIGCSGIDFNPTFFAHPKVKDGLTLSSPDETIRSFWVEHGKRCVEIAAQFGKAFSSPCLLNVWIPDGLKDVPSDRLSPRLRLKKSLDEIFATYDKQFVISAVESKVFGIGAESYTVGNSEFYQNYAATRNICCLLDNGHYHPTEVVSDKISSMLAFHDKVALHLTRSVRWDSDHVVLFEDELKEIAKEIVFGDATDRVLVALDYFDASINRISAWVTGQRSVQKALLYALLMPADEMKQLQQQANFTKLMLLQEKTKMLPFGDVWTEYLRRQNVEKDYYQTIKDYETLSLRRRNV